MKRFKTVASIMLTCLAVSFIIGTAYVYVKSFTSSVRSQQMNDVVSAEPQLMAEDNSVRFNSIAEYVAYLNSSESVKTHLSRIKLRAQVKTITCPVFFLQILLWRV